MSFKMPAAVTSAPAPGPLITSGSVRYRRVVKATRFRVPSSAPAGLDAGTAASFAETVRGVAVPDEGGLRGGRGHAERGDGARKQTALHGHSLTPLLCRSFGYELGSAYACTRERNK